MMRIELPKSLEKLEGKMVLYLPSSSKLDIDIPLNMNQHNEQYIRTEKMMKGVWLVKIYVKSANKNYYFERQIII